MQNFYSTILCTSLNLFVSYYRNMRLNQNSVPNCLMWLLSSEVVYAVHFFSSKYKVLICPIYHTLCTVIWGCMSTAMEKYIKHFHTSSCVFHLRSNKRQEPRLSSSTLLMPLKEFLALVFILQYNQSYGWSLQFCVYLCLWKSWNEDIFKLYFKAYQWFLPCMTTCWVSSPYNMLVQKR